MAIPNAPLTDNPSLDLTLLELINQFNILEQKHLKLIEDIKAASSLSDLQTRVEE
jgi:hypothetical protein|tara:strand:- start:972 stop:1136 length:165 start_codon:yes stop_codon:yes gene_type:complete